MAPSEASSSGAQGAKDLAISGSNGHALISGNKDPDVSDTTAHHLSNPAAILRLPRLESIPDR
jgi:hypothetical protein